MHFSLSLSLHESHLALLAPHLAPKPSKEAKKREQKKSGNHSNPVRHECCFASTPHLSTVSLSSSSLNLSHQPTCPNLLLTPKCPKTHLKNWQQCLLTSITSRSSRNSNSLSPLWAYWASFLLQSASYVVSFTWIIELWRKGLGFQEILIGFLG